MNPEVGKRKRPRAGKSLDDYRAVIFDVDGTLYDQRKLRRIMAARLLGHALTRPNRWRELKIVRVFRLVRERGTFPAGELATLQYQVAADRLGIAPAEVRAVVEEWIYRAPLPYLKSCRDEALARLVRQLRARGIVTVAYSDYPVGDKLRAMEIEMDFVFAATDPEINCLKPDPRGLRAILQRLSLSASECLFIGDRDDKDGLCARQAGVGYVILPGRLAARGAVYAAPPFSSPGVTEEKLVT